jgi:23S rRNA (cytidine1920-2'-O)/16S rRNA (cytidine1409-2'-O)-methyltransferase
MTRRRADVVLVDRGLFPSREKARAAILAGDVRVDGEPVSKAGAQIDPDAEIEVSRGPAYVSRGGDKLEGALEDFGVDPTGAVAMDVGSSTGGFTDCLLAHGAASVTAVDVGYGQLAWSLRNDSRVRVHERTNIRGADPEELGAPFDLIVIDVSFIGLAKVLPNITRMVEPDGEVLALVKPQFEAGPGRVGKGGVVRDPAVHEDAVASACSAARDLGWFVSGLAFSRLKGPKGNIEFWVRLSREGETTAETPADVVRRAHDALGG